MRQNIYPFLMASAIMAQMNQAPKGVLCGYWFEWDPKVDLTQIPIEYNIVCVAFMANGRIPTYTPVSYPEETIAQGISFLKSQGRQVLISLGGASGQIRLTAEDKQAFKDEVIRLVEKYGFTGMDIDLEGNSILAGDNTTVIPAVLSEVKDYYRSMGRDFLITMAPEFRYLRGSDAAYKPYITDLDGYYNYIWPQYYNQGADGIWSDEYQTYLSQNDNSVKEEFLYTLTHAIVTGTQDFIKIPSDKFAIGLPASLAAALNGYVEEPEAVRLALNRLKSEGNAIKGLMTWSVNQDFANGYEFVRQYSPMVSSLG